jgi:hypothetical protein
VPSVLIRPADILAMARRLVEQETPKELCQICYQIVEGPAPHECAVPDHVARLTRATMLGWMPDGNPAKRAKGYGVR